MKRALIGLVTGIILVPSLVGATSRLSEMYPTRIPPKIIPPEEYQNYPRIEVMRGVAVEMEDLETYPLVFLKIETHEEETNYLIIGREIYLVEETFSDTDPATGAKVFKYETIEGEKLVIITKKYLSNYHRAIAVSGSFKNYLLNFEPIYKYPKPLYPHIEPLPVSPIAKGIQKIKELQGDIKELIEKASPISEWTKD